MVVLMDPAKVNQEVDPLRVNRTREKRFVVGPHHLNIDILALTTS